MFGMSWTELLVIAVVALVVIGPDKIPEVARTMARFVRQAQKLIYEFKESTRLDELKQEILYDSRHVDARDRVVPQPHQPPTGPKEG